MSNYKIILASASPRRKEIMKQMGIPYQVIVAGVEETVSETEPSKMVQALASLKTEAVLSKYMGLDGNNGANKDNKDVIGNTEQKNFIIIGADTMVFYNGHALGKPRDEADAFRMLRMLAGNSHEVISGVSIIINDSRQERLSFAVTTKVMMQNLSDEQIKDYIATGEPMDKAGAYAIQGKFGIYIREIKGDYYNVVGFPISKIYEVLLDRGIDLKKQK